MINAPIPPASVVYVDKSFTSGYTNSASFANSVQYATTVPPNTNAIVSGLNLVGGGVTGSFAANQVSHISASQIIDNIPINKGNSVKWMIFLESGSNSRANKVVASWNNNTSSFYTTEINSIGDVPVNLSVGHSIYGVSLIATPEIGTWGVKLIRILI